MKIMQCMPKMRDNENGMPKMRDKENGMYAQNEV